jgi:hypothetical protein
MDEELAELLKSRVEEYIEIDNIFLMHYCRNEFPRVENSFYCYEKY